MDRIYVAHGGREVVIGGKVTFTDGATVNGGIIKNVPAAKATTVNGLKKEINALIDALKASGLMKDAPEEEPEDVSEEPEEQDDEE